MKLGQIADVLVAQAKKYRNGKLIKEIVPQIKGQPITQDIVRQVLTPYLDQIMPLLPAEVWPIMCQRFKTYAPKALDWVEVSTHMHNSRQTESLDQDCADALFIGFVNNACFPLDLALYAKDLLP